MSLSTKLFSLGAAAKSWGGASLSDETSQPVGGYSFPDRLTLVDVVLAGLLVTLLMPTWHSPVLNPAPEEVRMIAPAGAIVTTASLAIVGSVFAVLLFARRNGRVSGLRFIVPFFAYVGFMLLAFWRVDVFTVSASIYLCLSVTCFPLGIELGRRARASRLLMRLLIWIASAAALVWSSYSILQLFQADYAANRSTSIFYHPAEVGKIFLALLLLLLPATKSGSGRTKLVASGGVMLGVVAVLPTLTRVSYLSIFIALLVFFLIAPGRRLSISLIVWVLGAAAATSYFANAFLDRFEIDPSGGLRPELLAAGLRVLPEFWLVGVGPGRYVSTISEYSNVVRSSGQPVHNAHLLALTELGFVGYTIFSFPVLRTVMRSVRVLNPAGLWGAKRDYRQRLFAASTFSVALGLVPATLLDWGGLVPPSLPLTILLMGFSYAQLRGPTVRGGIAPRKLDRRRTDAVDLSMSSGLG